MELKRRMQQCLLAFSQGNLRDNRNPTSCGISASLRLVTRDERNQYPVSSIQHSIFVD